MVVNESATASFQCEADGNPEPEVAWLKQNSSLPADKRVVSSRGGLMTGAGENTLRRLALFVYLDHPTKNDVTSGKKVS